MATKSKSNDVESIVSKTTVASTCKKGPDSSVGKTAQQPTLQSNTMFEPRSESVVSDPTPSIVSSKHSNASKATTTVTIALKRQIAALEAQLEAERKERMEATKRIADTQKELDALEKLLRLNPTV